MPSAPSRPRKAGEYFTSFLILSAISLSILFAGLILGTEPRLVMERTGERTFRVTSSNYFAGRPFFARTVDGVTEVVVDDAVRAGRRDSAKEVRRRRRQKHLEFQGSDGTTIGWDRESDYLAVGEFMRGQEERFQLSDPPPMWRRAAAWFCIGLGSLSWIGAFQSSFFPRKNGSK